MCYSNRLGGTIDNYAFMTTVGLHRAPFYTWYHTILDLLSIGQNAMWKDP